jgi:hypothetical protein
MLPFTRDQFIAVFVAHHEAMWPLQWVALGLGAVIAGAVALRAPSAPWRQHLVTGGLAALWLASGVGYHALQFSAINRAAWLFALLFVLQALLWLQLGMWRPRWDVALSSGTRRVVGWVFVAYAAIAYPAIGLALGHRWPELPAFGLTPCPLTLFSVGVLLLARGPVPRRVLAIPLAWSVIGGSAALLLGMPQDWALWAALPALIHLWRHAGHRRLADV